MARTERVVLSGASHALRVTVLRTGLVFGLGDEVREGVNAAGMEHVVLPGASHALRVTVLRVGLVVFGLGFG